MHKGLFLQDSKGAPAMAGLLLFALCCTPLLGCIIPQDEQLIGELPPKRNGPIAIKRTDPPTVRTTWYNSTSCPSLEPSFKLTVEDEDLGDVMSSLWFIGDTNTQPYAPTPLPGGSNPRNVFPPSSLGFKSALANLIAGSAAVLTVYVADTSFQEVVGGQVALVPRDTKLPDGGSLDFGKMDSFTWVLDVEACP